MKRRDVASPSQLGDVDSPSQRGGVASPSQESLESLRSAPTVRYCSAAKWRPWMFRFAAMVPHTSFYVLGFCVQAGNLIDIAD